jgi:hypothetical protein
VAADDGEEGGELWFPPILFIIKDELAYAKDSKTSISIFCAK